MPRKKKQRPAEENAVPIRWMDKQDLFQLLHISERTLQNWRSKGLLPFYRISGKIFYKESDLHELLHRHKQGGGGG
ncbi:MAG: helix-turn-helix domain-containing protein [Bacteroidota bacterium]|nr:helix-turn-helix domain-containing protein [Bacteroidota bacterium]